jgi:hypothetical protein
MSLNETYIKVRVDKYLSDAFPILNGLEQGDYFQFWFRIRHQESLTTQGGTGIEWDTSASGLCWWSWFIGWKHKYHKNTEDLLDTSKEFGLQENAEETKIMFMSFQDQYTEAANKYI